MRRHAVFMLYVISCCVFSHVAASQARFPSDPDTSFNSPGNLNFGRANSAEPLLTGAIAQSIAATKAAANINQGIGLPFGGNDIAIFSAIESGQRSKVYVVSTTPTFISDIETRVAVAAYTQCDGLVDSSFNVAGNFVLSDGSTIQTLRPGFFALDFVNSNEDTLGEPGLRIAVDSNGRLGVLSDFTDSTANRPTQQPAVVFINPDGMLDTSVNQGDANNLNDTVVFAGGGVDDTYQSPNGVVLSVMNGFTTQRSGTPADFLFTSNNLPVVVGQSNATLGVGGNTSEKAYFFRLTANGLADVTFASQANNLIDIRGVASQAGLSDGAGGLWYSGIPGGPGQEGSGLLPRALARTSTNELFVAGGLAFGASSFGFITKLTNAGDIDTSFGTAGSNAFQVDGTQIPVAGDYQGVADGTVLISLGTLGPLTEITDLKVLSDGGVIAVGTFRGAVASLPANTNGFVAKFTSQGALDTSFNPTGSVLTFDGNNPSPGTSTPGILLFSTSSDALIVTAPTSICLTEGEQVIVTGNRIPGGNTNSLFVLALNADGTPNTNANPERTEYTYTGQIGNNPQLTENEGSDFAQYLAIYNMELVDNAVFRGCELNDQNGLFVGGPGRDEYLFALKIFGVGPDPVPVPEDSFVAALVDKYRPFCPTAPCQ